MVAPWRALGCLQPPRPAVGRLPPLSMGAARSGLPGRVGPSRAAGAGATGPCACWSARGDMVPGRYGFEGHSAHSGRHLVGRHREGGGEPRAGHRGGSQRRRLGLRDCRRHGRIAPGGPVPSGSSLPSDGKPGGRASAFFLSIHPCVTGARYGALKRRTTAPHRPRRRGSHGRQTVEGVQLAHATPSAVDLLRSRSIGDPPSAFRAGFVAGADPR